MNPRILMIAYHFPPVRVSSGLQRTLSFARELPERGWEPVVLTVHRQAYAATSEDQLGDVPEGITVRRARAWDTARHLSVGGRYVGWMAVPDRWVSWWPAGVLAGLRLVGRYRPSVIWSTYPIATAHLIGYTLQRLTGLPWVADFRDPMVSGDFPSEGLRRRAHAWLERRTAVRCARGVLTTPGALRLFRERYPEVPEDRWTVIENGYDEAPFLDAEAAAGERAAHEGVGPLVFVHSGTLYPSERDPTAFLEALASLKGAGRVSRDNLRVVLRATGHDDIFSPRLEALGLQDVVQLEPALPYRQALSEMLGADVLLLFQAANCNEQIPAKAYEYLRAGRPILALTDRKGDTAQLLRDAGVRDIVALDDAEAIGRAVARLLDPESRVEARRALVRPPTQYSRAARADELKALLNETVCVEGGAGPPPRWTVEGRDWRGWP